MSDELKLADNEKEQVAGGFSEQEVGRPSIELLTTKRKIGLSCEYMPYSDSTCDPHYPDCT